MTPQDGQPSRSLLELLTLLLQRRRLVFGLPLLTALAAIGFSLLLPRLYTSESRFTPESTRPQMSRLMGLATQFGLDFGSEGESVDFYAELLESRELLRGAILTEYEFTAADGDSMRGNLVDLLRIEGETEAERIRTAVEMLDNLVVARPDYNASIVTVRVSAPWPALAVALNARLLELMNEFNLDRRQSRARAERLFLENRLQEAEGELRAAEAAEEQFLNENRQFSESPQLRFQHTRLQRRVNIAQELYRSLAQGYEQARVDEVRNTPVLTVLDQPRPPAERTAPNFLVNGVLGLILGTLLALGIIILQELLASARRSRPREFAGFADAAHATLAALLPRRRGGRTRSTRHVGAPAEPSARTTSESGAGARDMASR